MHRGGTKRGRALRLRALSEVYAACYCVSTAKRADVHMIHTRLATLQCAARFSPTSIIR
jgi:hypothetical protein